MEPTYTVVLREEGAPVPAEEPIINVPEEERTGPLYTCRVTSGPLDEVLAHA